MIRDWGYGEPEKPEEKVRCPRCDTCGFEEDENYKHSTCSVCLGIGFISETYSEQMQNELEPIEGDEDADIS